MNGRIFVLMFLGISCQLFAQENYLDTFKIQPTTEKKGSGTYFLIGTASDQNVFKFVNMKKEVPKNFPQSKWIDYQKVLNGGLNSFLFEYKNYSQDISYYSLFSWGNFSAMGDSVLSIANEVFFPNRALLNKIYNWYAPEYKKAFKLLTVEEQQIYLSKVFMTEAFIKYVLLEKSTEKYNTWLKTYGLENDHYVTEFVERRVRKKQWTISDCKYWVKKVKNDFLPLLKKSEDPSAHYQVYDSIGEYLIAYKHDGLLAVLDKDFVEYNDAKYYNLDKINDSILVAHGGYGIEKRRLNVNFISRKGCLIEENKNKLLFLQYNDSVCYCVDKKTMNNGSCLFQFYDFKNKIVLEDSIVGAYNFTDTQIDFFKKLSYDTVYNDWYDEKFSFLIFDKDSCKLIQDPMETALSFDPETYEYIENVYCYPVTDTDEKILGHYIISKNKSYVFNKSGYVIHTFENNCRIGLCEKNENYICTYDYDNNEKSRFLKVLLNEKE